MLQQILEEMYIDPELLDELSEEQKQILFCKMREEQVRRWKVREEEEDKNSKKSNESKKEENGKSALVDFLLGRDGKEWVWVMGEHKDDKTIEQILEDEAHERASKQAEKEAEELRLKEEKLKATMDEENLKKEIEKTKEEIQRKKDEAEMFQSLKEAHISVPKREKEKKSVKKRNEVENSHPDQNLDDMKNRRSNEIYSTWKQKRNTLQKDAEENRKKLDSDWREQERRVKETERRMREIARRAREEHRRSLVQGTVKLITSTNAFKYSHKKGPAPPIPSKSKDKSNGTENGFKPLPARPRSREAVIRWFKKYEIPKSTVLDPKTKEPANWFHGLIGRTEAEDLLEPKRPGTFLVRVSERIWGYTISYRSAERCKHFLVDKSEENYHFFGSNQKEHMTLQQMISYHMKHPISSEKELLIYPCGQSVDPPDFSELFQGVKTESTAL